MKRKGETFNDVRVMKKVLRSLTRKFDYMVIDLLSSKNQKICHKYLPMNLWVLQTHEQKMKQNDDIENSKQVL